MWPRSKTYILHNTQIKSRLRFPSNPPQLNDELYVQAINHAFHEKDLEMLTNVEYFILMCHMKSAEL